MCVVLCNRDCWLPDFAHSLGSSVGILSFFNCWHAFHALKTSLLADGDGVLLSNTGIPDTPDGLVSWDMHKLIG